MRSSSSISSDGKSAFMNAFTVVETSSAFFVSGRAVCTTFRQKNGMIVGGGGAGGGRRVGTGVGVVIVASLSNLTIDDASLSRQSTVRTPTKDTSATKLKASATKAERDTSATKAERPYELIETANVPGTWHTNTRLGMRFFRGRDAVKLTAYSGTQSFHWGQVFIFDWFIDQVVMFDWFIDQVVTFDWFVGQIVTFDWFIGQVVMCDLGSLVK